jgi:hypothetical protein
VHEALLTEVLSESSECNRLCLLTTGERFRYIIRIMGQHKSYEKERSWFHVLLFFLAGSLLVAVSVYSMTYSSPGLIGAHGLGKVLGLGLIFMGAPIWAYIWRKKRRPRDSAR